MRPYCTFLSLALSCLASLIACSKQASNLTTSASPDSIAPENSAKIVIITPHNELIRNEFKPAFKDWYVKKNQEKPVPEIEWQAPGGAGDINKFLISSFAALGANAEKGIGIDLYFGGGIPAFAQIKQKGISAPLQLDPDLIHAIPQELAGVTLRDPDNQWYGVVLSSFGIIYNKTGLRAKGLPEPQTWADLANPAYFNTLILADPAKSGSARVTYEVILQKYGWEAGWALLMRIAGNAREFTASSDAVPREVSQGSGLAGSCVDYYGYSQVSQTGPDIVGYVSPANATAITPDPICMLRGAPHPELAKAFITFTLSPEGQALFGLKAGAPAGPRHNLFRMPIRPDFYQHDAAIRLFSVNPFTATSTFNINEQRSEERSPLLGPLFAAAFLNNKQRLQAAWQTVLARPQDIALKVKFTAVPFVETQGLELAKKYSTSPREAIQLDREWQEMFAKRYVEIAEAAK